MRIGALFLVVAALGCVHVEVATEPVSRLDGHAWPSERRLGIEYADRDGRPLCLDLWIPECPGPHPVVVLFHGGGWKTGGRGIFDAYALADALSREGIAVASASYRLVAQATWPAQIEDARRAIQFVRANAARFGLDPARIAAMGASSGGHLAALLATQDDQAQPGSADPIARESTRPDCVVAFSAPFDLQPRDDEVATTLQITLVSEFLGVDKIQAVDEKLRLLRERGRDASPLCQVRPGAPPFLLIDGKVDTIVPPVQGERMAAALRDAGVPCERMQVETPWHCRFLLADPRGWTSEPPPFWTAVRAFLRSRLRLDAEAKTPPLR
ncbi:MAG: alpha/beta hydrolase [Planctomycetota bacterium]